jgi:hypothetical protein
MRHRPVGWTHVGTVVQRDGGRKSLRCCRREADIVGDMESDCRAGNREVEPIARAVDSATSCRSAAVYGKYLTTAGVSAGIDGGVCLASRLVGEDAAKLIQRGIDYEPSTAVRADRLGPCLVESLRLIWRGPLPGLLVAHPYLARDTRRFKSCSLLFTLDPPVGLRWWRSCRRVGGDRSDGLCGRRCGRVDAVVFAVIECQRVVIGCGRAGPR